jgi:hypothetical protein
MRSQCSFSWVLPSACVPVQLQHFGFPVSMVSSPVLAWVLPSACFPVQLAAWFSCQHGFQSSFSRQHGSTLLPSYPLFIFPAVGIQANSSDRVLRAERDDDNDTHIINAAAANSALNNSQWGLGWVDTANPAPREKADRTLFVGPPRFWGRFSGNKKSLFL